MDLHNAIQLDDKTLRMISESNLDLPFVILNIDIANEKRLHKMKCAYVRQRMLPDSKKLHDTGSHWLLLEKDAPPESTRNCNGKNCWKAQ